jgi:hypothetical protein
LAKLPDVTSADFIDTILHENQFYYAGNYFGSNGRVYSGLLYVLKKKRLEKQSVDFKGLD